MKKKEENENQSYFYSKEIERIQKNRSLYKLVLHLYSD